MLELDKSIFTYLSVVNPFPIPSSPKELVPHPQRFPFKSRANVLVAPAHTLLTFVCSHLPSRILVGSTTKYECPNPSLLLSLAPHAHKSSF